MKFATAYQIGIESSSCYPGINEFNIKFTDHSSFQELRKFVKSHLSYRINIEFINKDNYNTEDIIDFCDDFENVFLRIHPWELSYLPEYDEKNVNYFFDNSMPIYSYSLLEFALNCKTKGIYITDDLTYNLPEVHQQCQEKGIELRVILNKLPITNFLASICPTVQVYKPQDYSFLDQYYSVGEFDYDEDLTKLEVLYEHWFVTHEWESDLEFMNHDLKLPYPTESMVPELTKIRSKCQHRCTMRSENTCSKCKRFLLMGYRNADNNLVYKDSERGLPSLKTLIDSFIVSKQNNPNE